MREIFTFRDYKSYLITTLDHSPKEGRGLRRQWAEACGCQVAYISHVLVGHAHLSLEQAEALANFLKMSKNEREYFVLLVQFQRAATPSLKGMLEGMLEELRRKQDMLKDRMRIRETLSREDQAVYYSHWYYAAIHMLLTIPQFRDRETIAERFRLPLDTVQGVLDFLSTRGFTRKVGREHVPTGKFLHLEEDSPLLPKHHVNWRMKAIQSLEVARTQDLHYSGVFTVAEADLPTLKKILAKALQDSAELIKPSPEEKIAVLSMDLFEL